MVTRRQIRGLIDLQSFFCRFDVTSRCQRTLEDKGSTQGQAFLLVGLAPQAGCGQMNVGGVMVSRIPTTATYVPRLWNHVGTSLLGVCLPGNSGPCCSCLWGCFLWCRLLKNRISQPGGCVAVNDCRLKAGRHLTPWSCSSLEACGKRGTLEFSVDGCPLSTP